MSKHPNLQHAPGRPPAQRHIACLEAKANPIEIGKTWQPSVWPEDVRRCPCGLGKIQICYQPGGSQRGPGTTRWRDLSALFEPRRYRQAVDLLRQNSETKEPK